MKQTLEEENKKEEGDKGREQVGYSDLKRINEADTTAYNDPLLTIFSPSLLASLPFVALVCFFVCAQVLSSSSSRPELGGRQGARIWLQAHTHSLPGSAAFSLT